MEKLSKFIVSRLASRQQSSAEHPDADVLTAFAESRLSSQERKTVLAHLGRCPDCRDVMALITDGSTNPIPARSSQVHPMSQWWRWAAALGVACLVTAIVWHPDFGLKNPPPTQILMPKTAKLPPAFAPDLPAIPKQEAQEHKTLQRKPVKLKRSPAKQNPALEAKVDHEIPLATPTPSMLRADSFLQQQPQSFVRAITPQPPPQATRFSFRSIWRLPPSADEAGSIQKSIDGGQTWKSIQIAVSGNFYALSTRGPAIWAGGTEGMLLHSVDNGLHWVAVPVEDAGTRLTSTIIAISVSGETTVNLKVQGGGSWVSFDSGLHWHQE